MHRFFDCFRSALFLFLLSSTPLFSQNIQFENRTDQAGVGEPADGTGYGHGVAAGDFDGDGLVDIYLVVYQNENHLFKNNGDGTFADIAQQAGVRGSIDLMDRGVASADYDNDGDMDIYVAAAGGNYNLLFRNNGDATFSDVAASAGVRNRYLQGQGVAWGDYDNDGDLDLYLAGYETASKLFRQNADHTFSDVTASVGLDDAPKSVQAMFFDANADGNLDLMVSRGQTFENRLFINNGNGTFTDRAANWHIADPSPHGQGLAVADYDGDGDLDVYMSDAEGPNRLYRNNGSTFSEVAGMAGVNDYGRSLGCQFADFDNDGWPDLYVLNFGRNRLYRNNGDGTFSDISSGSGADNTRRGYGSAVFDYDDDGNLDIFFGNSGQPSVLLRNTTTGQNWLGIDLTGTTSNRDGVGARVIVHANGRQQLQQLVAGFTMVSGGSDLTLHFGLEQSAVADSVEIFWPSGQRDVLANLPANQRFEIEEGGILHYSDETPPVISQVTVSDTIATSAIIAWQTNEPATAQIVFGPDTTYGHQSRLDTTLALSHVMALDSLLPDTTYHFRVFSSDALGNLATSNDFTFHTLVANGVHFTDITLAAGTGGPAGANEVGGHAAVFADVDFDARPDLYITMLKLSEEPVADLFFRNTGDNIFVEEAAQRGIGDFDIGSHGTVFADLDNDGDFDLFNGGTGAQNQIYRNDGYGYFADATPESGLPPREWETRGVVAFDMDGDGDLDLVGVTNYLGSNDPPDERNEIYRNDGNLQFTAIDSGDLFTAPMGQGITASDFDGDGDIDIFAANRTGVFNVLINTGNGNFVRLDPADIGIDQQAKDGITFGDVDNDGDLDILLASDNVGYLYRNNGNGFFAPDQSFSNTNGYMAAFGDLDNDGDLDLVFAGDDVSYLNDGTGSFSQGPPIPVDGIDDPRGVGLADIDGDGDLDFAFACKRSRNWLLRNDINSGNWIKVQLISPQGVAGAFGAKVRIYPAQQAGGTLLGMREARSANGYLGQNDPVLHIGTGEYTAVDVVVDFQDGTSVTLTGEPVGQTLLIDGRLADISPPVVSGVSAQITGSTSARISWLTNEISSSQVEYGPTPALGTYSDLNNAWRTGHAVTLADLLSSVTYYYRVISVDPAGNSTRSDTRVFTTPDPDTTPPLITNITAAELQPSLLRITWDTDEPATSQVEYGLDTGYGVITPEDTALVTAHALLLQGLNPATAYHFRVISTDIDGNSGYSADQQITTQDSDVFLADDFSGGSLDPAKWSIGDHPNNQSGIENGALVLRSNSSNSSGWVYTKDFFPARNITVQFKVAQASKDGCLEMSPTVNGSALTGFFNEPNWYRFYNYRDGDSGPYKLYVQWRKNGAVNGLDVAPGVDFTSNFYLRLRTADSTLFFDYSLDGSTWTNAYSETFALPGYSLDDSFAFALTAFRTQSNGDWIVDDFAIAGGSAGAPDTAPPAISAVTAYGTAPAEAHISWQTDELANARVEYGLDSTYSQSTAIDPGMTTAHSISLVDLLADTTVHFRVISADAAGNIAISGDFTLKTLPPLADFVALHGIYDIALQAAAAGATPYVSGPSVQVTFTGISGQAAGRSHSIEGFWDGGSRYRIRFAADATGEWSWLSSSDDPGLNGRSGTFTCSGALPVGHISAKGFVRPSPAHPYTLEHADGTPFFIMGDTQWSFSTSALAWPDEFQAYVDARSAQGFNYVHGALYQTWPLGNNANEGGPAFYADNVDSLNPGFWQAFDQRIAYLNAKGLVCGAMLAWGDNGWAHFATDVQRERFIRYLVDRYAAYNLIWITAGEYEEFPDIATNTFIGETLAALDPYQHPITSHTLNTSADDYGNAPWHSLIYQQTGDPAQITADRRFDKPVINSEFGYEGNLPAEDVRRLAWEIVMRGGFFVYGDTSVYHYTAKIQRDRIYPPGSAYMTHLKKFWTEAGIDTVHWWRFSRFDSLGNKRWQAGIPGAEYVLYTDSPDSFAIDLSETVGGIVGQWYDTRNGRWDAAFTGHPAAAFAVQPPDSGYAAFIKIVPDAVAPVITNVAVIDTGMSTAVIRWDTDEPANAQVEYGLTANFGQWSGIDSTFALSQQITLTNLLPDTTYHFSAHSVDPSGNVAVSPSRMFRTLPAPPDTVPPLISQMQTIGISDSSAGISWLTNEPATAQVEFGTTPALGQFTVATTTPDTAHTVALNQLLAGTTYFYTAIAVDVAGNVARSDTLAFTTLAPDTTPPAIAAVTVLEVQNNFARIAWQTDEPATSQIEYGTDANYGAATPLDSQRVVQHEILLQGLAANTTYHFRAISADSSGNTAYSPDQQFTTPNPVLLADDFSGSSLDPAKWRLGDHPYNQSGIENGALVLRANSSTSSGWVYTKDFFPAENLTVQVKVVQPNKDGCLEMSPTVTPGALIGFFNEPNWYRFYNYRDSNTGPFKLYVQWRKNGVVDGLDVAPGVDFTAPFYLRLRTGDSTIYFEYSLDGNTWTTAYSEAFALPGYSLGDPFAFALTAFRTQTHGDWIIDDFAIESIAPPADISPPVISQVQTTGISDSSAGITWQTDEPARRQVEYGLTADYGNWTPHEADLQTNHQVTLANLAPSTTYHFRAWNWDAANNSAVSADFSFTTTGLDTVPPVISNVRLDSLGADRALVLWDTDEPANASVEFGVSAAYGQVVQDGTLQIAHRVWLTSLGDSTRYHFRVRNTDASGNKTASGDSTFTTRTAHLLADDFNATKLDTSKWVLGRHPNNATTVANGTLVLRSTSGNSSGWLRTREFFSGRNKSVQIKVVQANDDGCLEMSPTVDDNALSGFYSEPNWYRFYNYRDNHSGPYKLYVQWRKNGSVGGLAVAQGVDFSGVFYLKIRTNAFTIFFEYSFDGANWTTAYSEAFSLPGYALADTFAFALSGYHTATYGDWIVDEAIVDSLAGGAAAPRQPTLAALADGDPTASSVAISWQTRTPATSQVEFGPDANYGFTSSLQPQLTTTHAVAIQGLAPATRYHYRVISIDGIGSRVISEDRTFTTRASDPLLLATLQELKPQVQHLGARTAEIAFATEYPATYFVRYGTTPQMEQISAPAIATPNGYRIGLQALNPAAIYYFALVAESENSAAIVAKQCGRFLTTSDYSPRFQALLQAEHMPQRLGGDIRSGNWLATGSGQIAQELVFPNTGRYRVSIRARTGGKQGGETTVALRVGENRADSVAIESSTWNVFSFDLEIAAGAHPVTLTLAEPPYRPVATWQHPDTLYVDWLRIEGTAILTKSTDPAQAGTAIPERFALSRPYPSPFNPATRVNLDLPEAGRVQAIIFDITGSEVARLVDKPLAPGTHVLRWDGTNASGSKASSGMYLLRVVFAGNSGKREIATQRLLLMK